MISRPYLIAGPCSAESERQVLNTASGLKSIGADVFRAGLWKPRTHPGGFEGIGREGLPWLMEVKAQTGLPVATEVACSEHVQLVLNAGLDMVWIGARTTPNPFLVQEIAESLSGSDIQVWVKNPVSQDVEIWAGAVERLIACGVKNIGLIFRGFATFDHICGRNASQWLQAVEMRTRFPQLKMLCDPSHMAGCKDLIPEMAARAMELGMDGLMVESHYDPSSALSDASQQLLPDELGALMMKLNLRNGDAGRQSGKLDLLRGRIDEIDDGILSLLASRMDVSKEIGYIKQEQSMPIIQPQRWEQVLSSVRGRAEKLGLDPDFAQSVYECIHDASVAQQK